MDRRSFIGAVVGSAIPVGAMGTVPEDRTLESKQERLLADFRGLEAWAKAMREQFEKAGPGCTLHRCVLPSIAPWFGGILARLASIQE